MVKHFPRAMPPNSSALLSPFVNLFSAHPSWLLILPGDSVYLQSHSHSLPCFLHFPCLSLDVSESYPLSAEGLGETETHSQKSFLPSLKTGQWWVWGWCADSQDQQGPGIHLDYLVQLFLRPLVKPKDFKVLLHCSRPGGPAVSHCGRLPGASPRSPPTDCTWPHCQAGKLF